MLAKDKSVDIYSLPADLENYVQEYTASGLGKLKLMNIAYPVFIMNPVALQQYTEQFKEVIVEVHSSASPNATSDPVPEGEIWEITVVNVFSTGAAGTCQLRVYNGTTFVVIHRELNSTNLNWTGSFYLTEGMYVECGTGAATTFLSILGVKRYA